MPSSTPRLHIRSQSEQPSATRRQLQLVAEIAVAGLARMALSPDDRAEFYEGLSAILPPPGAEAARYAAICRRESQRAQREILTVVETGRGGV